MQQSIRRRKNDWAYSREKTNKPTTEQRKKHEPGINQGMQPQGERSVKRQINQQNNEPSNMSQGQGRNKKATYQMTQDRTETDP